MGFGIRWPVAGAALTVLAGASTAVVLAFSGLIFAGLTLGSVAFASLAFASGPPARSESIALDAIPIPHQVHARGAPVAQTKSKLVPFDTAPFPYNGAVPRTGKPFLDVTANGRRGHQTSHGVLWEDETFNDRSVLLHIPKGFDARRPSLMVVFFHGNGATVGDDVFKRQQVPAQLTA